MSGDDGERVFRGGYGQKKDETEQEKQERESKRAQNMALALADSDNEETPGMSPADLHKEFLRIQAQKELARLPGERPLERRPPAEAPASELDDFPNLLGVPGRRKRSRSRPRAAPAKAAEPKWRDVLSSGESDDELSAGSDDELSAGGVTPPAAASRAPDRRKASRAPDTRKARTPAFNTETLTRMFQESQRYQQNLGESQGRPLEIQSTTVVAHLPLLLLNTEVFTEDELELISEFLSRRPPDENVDDLLKYMRNLNWTRVNKTTEKFYKYMEEKFPPLRGFEDKRREGREGMGAVQLGSQGFSGLGILTQKLFHNDFKPILGGLRLEWDRGFKERKELAHKSIICMKTLDYYSALANAKLFEITYEHIHLYTIESITQHSREVLLKDKTKSDILRDYIKMTFSQILNGQNPENPAEHKSATLNWLSIRPYNRLKGTGPGFFAYIQEFYRVVREYQYKWHQQQVQTFDENADPEEDETLESYRVAIKTIKHLLKTLGFSLHDVMSLPPSYYAVFKYLQWLRQETLLHEKLYNTLTKKLVSNLHEITEVEPKKGPKKKKTNSDELSEYEDDDVPDNVYGQVLSFSKLDGEWILVTNRVVITTLQDFLKYGLPDEKQIEISFQMKDRSVDFLDNIIKEANANGIQTMAALTAAAPPENKYPYSYITPSVENEEIRERVLTGKQAYEKAIRRTKKLSIYEVPVDQRTPEQIRQAEKRAARRYGYVSKNAVVNAFLKLPK